MSLQKWQKGVRGLSKKDKITFSVVTVALLVFLVLFLMLPYRTVMDYSFIIIIALAAYLGYVVYVLRKRSEAKKKAKEKCISQYGATMNAQLKHISGLPLAEGVMVTMYYGPEKIVFKKDKQEISIAREKITSIDGVTGKDIKSRQISGAAAGKFIIGGTAGAVIGSLVATTIYLVISYTSGGENKYVILDTAMSGSFYLNVQKDFAKTNNVAPTSIEL